MWRCVVLILLSPGWAATLQVEIRNSEVWLIGDGQPKQLTNDGKAKLQAELSPSRDRVAYYEQCPQVEHCTPSIIILNLAGDRTGSFQPKRQAIPQAELCTSILSIAWTGQNTIASECHINPSLSEYIETDLSNGQNIRDLLGYDFARSPDGKNIAHAGWIVHFAPPYAHSNYLQVENTTVYPLPKGRKPVAQKGLAEPPDVVRNRGLTYFGIHDFQPGLSWAPDSRRIALIDCTYDWTAEGAGSPDTAGEESNRRCSLAIVARNGQFTLHPLTGLSTNEAARTRLSWTSPHQLWLDTSAGRKSFDVR
ncbi:MAG: hypothetical protein LAQ69_48735 [Acidobacteriia bacterium]|nr:hypothetical protein [Terriglobia bacterium]